MSEVLNKPLSNVEKRLLSRIWHHQREHFASDNAALDFLEREYGYSRSSFYKYRDFNDEEAANVEPDALKFEIQHPLEIDLPDFAPDAPIELEEIGQFSKRVEGVESLASEDFETNPVADDFLTKGTSTLYRDGKEVLKWVKNDRNDTKRVAVELIESLKQDLPKVKPRKHNTSDYSAHNLAVYPIADSHFGMFSWKEETGDDFDLKIAESNLCTAIDRLVQTAPACEQALIINLGDFLHADNNDGKTARSGHILDTDTRWAKVLRVGLSTLRQCIVSALEKHKHVTVVNIVGNHDEHTAMFLTVALSHIYENEPRVTVINSPAITHYFRFGKVLIAMHHGHTIKMDKLPLVVATERAQDWGETIHRYGYTGHIHTDTKKEYGGMVVESFRTLAPRDAWHASMGYKAGRDLKAIVHHREFGEIERYTISVPMIEKIHAETVAK